MIKTDESDHLLPRERCTNESEERVDRIRMFLGIAYMMAMGICGIVLTAIGSTLDEIAKNCGKDSTQIGGIFIARGAGAIIGAVSSASLYQPPQRGNRVLSFTLFCLTILLISTPFIKNVWVLYGVFASFGFCTAVTDTGCQIMTRKTHGVKAGPWLGANTVLFGIAGTLVPLVNFVTTKLIVIFSILAGSSLVTFGMIMQLPNPEDESIRVYLPPMAVPATKVHDRVNRPSSKGWVQQLFVNEALFGSMVFWLIGGKVMGSSYVEDFVTTSTHLPAKSKSLALMMIWVFITIGRLIGLCDQIYLEKLGDEALGLLSVRLAAWIVIGMIGGLFLWFSSKSVVLFWLGLALYGFGNGPCIGYCYDLNNRLTIASELGMSIVMFGLNFGASFIPFVSTKIWRHTELGPMTLPMVLCVSQAVSLPLLYIVMALNNIKIMK